MPETTTTSRGVPEGRYGVRRKASRRTIMIGAGAMIALILVWCVVVALRYTSNPVKFSNTAISVSTVTRAEVTFQVSMKPGSKAICTIRALNTRMEVVGQLDVTVGPSREESFTVVREIPTSEKAESGGVKDCALA